MTLLGKGIYSLPQAARLVGVPPQRLRRWVVGVPSGQAALPTPTAMIDGEPVLEFADLISALFIQAFREKHVSLQHIRRAALNAAKELRNDRPFSLRNFATDGRRIFHWLGDDKRHLLDAETGQHVMIPIFKPLLQKIRYGITLEAERWYPLGERRHVVIDPAIALGEPSVRGVPTRVLFGPVKAGNSPSEVASWYGLARAEVLAACQFEKKMHAEAA
jgi:uncharacterized protein (DUF433 family)